MSEHLPSQALTKEEKEALAWKTPERLEDAAKFLATMVSMSLLAVSGYPRPKKLPKYRSPPIRPASS